jgi:hypothetical protein
MAWPVLTADPERGGTVPLLGALVGAASDGRFSSAVDRRIRGGHYPVKGPRVKLGLRA